MGGGENSVHGPNGIRPKNPACECKENSCKTHLHHPFCRPCGPDCVNNPLCGYSKYWCSVADPDKCNEPYAHHLGDCSGPFPRFPYCEESIQTFLETPGLPEAQKTSVSRSAEYTSAMPRYAHLLRMIALYRRVPGAQKYGHARRHSHFSRSCAIFFTRRLVHRRHHHHHDGHGKARGFALPKIRTVHGR